MKRKEDQQINDEADNKRAKLDINSNNWESSSNRMVHNNIKHNVTSNTIIITTANTDLYSSLPGRRSFGGFNAIIEQNYHKCMEDLKFEKAVNKAHKSTISDEEMLKRYEGLIGLPRGPNQGKAKVNNNNNNNNNNRKQNSQKQNSKSRN